MTNWKNILNKKYGTGGLIMSELIDKMNIDELRVYARSLERVKVDNLDVNYVSD